MKPANPRAGTPALRPAQALAAWLLVAGQAHAQVAEPPAPPPPPIAPAQAWRIVPSVSLIETYSDNFALATDDVARGSMISDLSPGLRIERNGARLRVFADTRLHYVNYAKESRFNETTRYVDALATFEAVEKWLYLDGRASITQQNLSPFGAAVSPDSPSPNANRVETSVYQFAPYVRGHLGGFADYQLRHNETTLLADEADLPRTRVSSTIGRVRNPSPSAKVGWALDLRDLRINNDTIGSQNDSRASASLLFGLDSTLQATVNAGRESTDFNGGARESSDTYGAGIAWAPSPRTQVAGLYEKRFFGDAHDVNVTHRTARTIWRLASSRDATTFATELTAGNNGSVQALMADLLVAIIPDPVARQQEARRRLAQTGVPNGASLSSGFLTERPYILRNDEASALYQGLRDTLSVRFSRSESRALGGAFTSTPGLPVESDVREREASASWMHRLTPLTAFTAQASTRRVEGLSTPGETRQKVFSLYFTSRLGPRTYAGFGLRHTQFDGTTQGDYRENAIVGSLSYQP